MPLYEYQCRKCKHRFERIQKFSDAILKTCPECGGTVDQLLSAPAVRFKGSGWYATDYARKGSGKSSGEQTGEKAASDKAGSEKAGSDKAGSDSGTATPETKPETKSKHEPGHKKSHDKKK